MGVLPLVYTSSHFGVRMTFGLILFLPRRGLLVVLKKIIFPQTSWIGLRILVLKHAKLWVSIDWMCSCSIESRLNLCGTDCVLVSMGDGKKFYYSNKTKVCYFLPPPSKFFSGWGTELRFKQQEKEAELVSNLYFFVLYLFASICLERELTMLRWSH